MMRKKHRNDALTLAKSRHTKVDISYDGKRTIAQ